MQIEWTDDSFPEFAAMRAVRECAEMGINALTESDGEGGLFLGAARRHPRCSDVAFVEAMADAMARGEYAAR